MKEPKSKIERLWQHRGMFALALAIPLGHRCGYVRVPDDHEWKDIYSPEALARYEKYAEQGTMFTDVDGVPENLRNLPLPSIYADADSRMHLAREEAWASKLDVHGGVTFAHMMESGDWERTTEAGDGIPGGLWVGFDCAHAWDNRDPEILRMFGEKHAGYYAALMGPLPGGEIRTLDYVVGECESMIDQILAARILDEVEAIVNGEIDAIP